jgi:uncharacterized protein (TIGR01777 family)
VSATRVTLTGATGLIGPQLLKALRSGGSEVTILTRNPDRAREKLGEVEAVAWDLMSEPAPAEALAGRDAVVHLAGEPVAQRWSAKVKRAIHESRVQGTRNLIEGIRAAEPRPGTLVSSSAIGYYGAHGEEPLDEEAPAGRDFLAQVCADWEAEAARATELGLRVVQVRTGVVLDSSGGALAKMLPPFRLGVGGPVAGGRQYISWIHTADLVGLMLAALGDRRWSGPINATAPEPLRNSDFSHVLGKVLKRPSLLPVPGFALQLLYGEMAEIVTTGARVVPAKGLVLSYDFQHPELKEALRSALNA